MFQAPFGVGLGGGNALKRFVEDADDPLLLGERGNWDLDALYEAHVEPAPIISAITSHLPNFLITTVEIRVNKLWQ